MLEAVDDTFDELFGMDGEPRLCLTLLMMELMNWLLLMLYLGYV